MRKRGWCISLLVVLVALTCSFPVRGASSENESKPIDLDKDPNLLGWWKFDEDSGETAADSSKFGRNGTLRGGLSFKTASVDGKIGKALKLRGRDEYVEITGYKGVTGNQARTVAAWIKTGSSQGEIVSWGHEDFGQMFIFGFIRQSIGVTPHGGYLYIAAKAEDNEWHHVAVVVDEAELPNLHDHVTLYMDGTVQEIHDIGLLDLWPLVTGSDLDVRIGRGFTGLLDDVRIYDRPLSEDEIRIFAGTSRQGRRAR